MPPVVSFPRQLCICSRARFVVRPGAQVGTLSDSETVQAYDPSCLSTQLY